MITHICVILINMWKNQHTLIHFQKYNTFKWDFFQCNEDWLHSWKSIEPELLLHSLNHNFNNQWRTVEQPQNKLGPVIMDHFCSRCANTEVLMC